MKEPMQELLAQKIWLLWKWGTRNGKKTKVPVALDGGSSGTSAEWSHTWGTSNEAFTAYRNVSISDGIGFVIPKGYFFLDKDDVDLDDPFVKLLLERFNSYAEKSVSGNGLHIYGKCDFDKLPLTYDKQKQRYRLNQEFYVKNTELGLELYIGGVTNHFAVFTGKSILNEPLKDCTDAVLLTLDKEMRKKEKAKYSPKRDGETDDDKEVFHIIEALRHQMNSEKFVKLFDKGDISDYGSASEADAALFSMIAFRTGPDPDMIIRIAQQSALKREKWNRDDYLRDTAESAISLCDGHFVASKMEHPDFICFRENGQPYVHSALLAKWTREHLTYILVRDNSKQGILTYVYENGCYRLYAPEMLKGIIKGYIAEYDEKLVSMGSVNETYNQLMTDLCYVPQEALNADESLINYRNGLLHITKDGWYLSDHDPAVLSTIQLPCNWTGKPSPTPVFDKYLDTLVDGNEGVKNLILQYMGVIFSNIKGYRLKKSLFMEGAGDTGKSQLKSLTEWILGAGNFIGIDLKEIEARFGTGTIYGTRLAGSSDMSFLSVDELKTFKMLTGGDSVFAEFKGQQGFQYTYNGLLWFCMNRLPKFGGDDGQWVYDRILVVHCPNIIPKDKQDKTLLEKMYAERDGIMFKCIVALQQVIANGYRFDEPECVRLARESYMADNNTIVAFFNECMEKRPDSKIPAGDRYTTRAIYRAYKSWCIDNNNGYSKSEKDFREGLAAYLNTTVAQMKVERSNGTYYRDYTISKAYHDENVLCP